MLELKNVKKKYKTKAGEVYALNGVSLTFPTAGMVFVTGKSGCGKTTLLNVIGGLDAIDEGDILIQDKSFSAFSPKEYDAYRNTFVGFIFQEYNLLAEYTVEYNVKMALELQGREADEEEIDRLFKEVDIEELRTRKPSELSGGQRQRVAIARALVKRPQIIMADEPTGALDSVTAKQVFDTLKKLSKDKLVIVVSHDNEFAEKYADRIIRLVDGRVVEDITFAEREIAGNVSEQEDTLVIREGAQLSEREKDVVATAIKERKKLEITENPSYREKCATGKVERKETQPIALKNSKMKFRSSAYLGVKSLGVKPVRLVITILISALAFAVFGLFDTIANFNTARILKNSLLEKDSTVVANASYIVDEDREDKYGVKVSEQVIERLAEETDGAVKGIFDFRLNTSGGVYHSASILEITESDRVIGKSYYANTVNGFVEFAPTEKALKEFGCRVVEGRYPKLLYNERGIVKESLKEVAISTYLADCILFYLNGETLNGEEVATRADLIDKTVCIGDGNYKIVGLIDCGEIPKKYDVIKNLPPYDANYYALMEDYTAYIDGGLHKCLFVEDGYKNAYKKSEKIEDVFYGGNNDWFLNVEGVKESKKAMGYVYNVDNYDVDKTLLFSGEYPQSAKIPVADDEIFIHHENLRNLFVKDINALEDEERERVTSLFNLFAHSSRDSNREALKEILSVLQKEPRALTAKLKLRSGKTGETVEKEVKIVGVYFGVDSSYHVDSTRMKIMMSSQLMDELNVYSKQGDYTKILFSAQSVKKSADKIVEYFTTDEGLSLSWYNNSVLLTIESNETMIRQASKLFLYATIALAVFSVFMLYNYISTSIANKKRSVGVLRGLGACGKDVFLVFLCESLIIAIINGVLASAFSALGCLFVNSYIKNTMQIFVSFALFGVRQVLLITGMSLLLSVISSALPIIKISKKKPVELIRQP